VATSVRFSKKFARLDQWSPICLHIPMGHKVDTVFPGKLELKPLRLFAVLDDSQT
jgi:hypothetical protein